MTQDDALAQRVVELAMLDSDELRRPESLSRLVSVLMDLASWRAADASPWWAWTCWLAVGMQLDAVERFAEGR